MPDGGHGTCKGTVMGAEDQQVGLGLAGTEGGMEGETEKVCV